MTYKINIAVSSCLLGEAVRYDGTDKRINLITDELAKEYNLIPLCPEMAIGLGVPRPPIHLIDINNQIEVVRVDNPIYNFTEQLSAYGKKVAELNPSFSGYIFKKNSPSCGTKNVKVFNLDGDYEMCGKGIYADTIMQLLPDLPVIDESDFLEENLREEFLLRITEYFGMKSIR